MHRTLSILAVVAALALAAPLNDARAGTAQASAYAAVSQAVAFPPGPCGPYGYGYPWRGHPHGAYHHHYHHYGYAVPGYSYSFRYGPRIYPGYSVRRYYYAPPYYYAPGGSVGVYGNGFSLQFGW